MSDETSRITAGDHFERGMSKEEAGDTDSAIADFSKAIRLDSENFDSYVMRGNLLIDINVDNAILDYSEAIRIRPQSAIPYYNRGMAHLSKRDFKAAISDFTTAANLGFNVRNSYFLYYNRGLAHKANNNIEAAISDLTFFLQSLPQESFFNRAEVKGWIQELSQKLSK